MSKGASGIYTITSPSGKVYVGSAVSITRRQQRHQRDMARGVHANSRLQNAANKYGVDAMVFAHILSCERADLIRYEQILIDDLNPFYNICRVAGSRLGVALSDAAKAKLSAANKGKVYGPMSEETKAKLSAANKGRPGYTPSKETREKLSVALKGRVMPPCSEETRAKMSAASKGRKFTPRSDEARARMSAAQKGRIFSPEHRAKIAARVLSDETREKMAAAKRGRKNSEETKAKRSASQKAYYARKRADALAKQGFANAQ